VANLNPGNGRLYFSIASAFTTWQSCHPRVNSYRHSYTTAAIYKLLFSKLPTPATCSVQLLNLKEAAALLWNRCDSWQFWQRWWL